MGGLTKYFKARQIGGGEMTEAWIKEMMAKACKTNVESLVEPFEEKLESLAFPFGQSVGNVGLVLTRWISAPTQETFVL
jgi:hypothetical protein